MLRILVVDDEPTYRVSLTRALTKNGYNVTVAASGEDAISLIGASHFDLLITDLKMPGMNGIELIAKTRDLSPATASIVMTAYGSIETAIEAIKLGAFHYILKPFNIDDLLLLAKRAVEHEKLKQENIYLKQEISGDNLATVDEIIGNTDVIVSLREQVQQLANGNTPVLLYGEPGTGKDYIATLIHKIGDRHNSLFVKIDASVYTSDKLELELFGYVKGAFEGATSNKSGKLEIADGGTLYIKNIDKLSLAMQAKINDLLTRGLFEPIGSEKPKAVDVKLIVSTQHDLEDLVQRGRFKESLYSNLELSKIYVPSLRDRKEDIQLLLQYFIQKHSKSMKKQLKSVSSDILEILKEYTWPQNLRELDNVARRFVILNDEEITLDSLPKKILGREDNKHIAVDKVKIPKIILPDDGLNINLVIKTIEEDLIIQALEKTSWNKNQAAKLLDLNRTTLVEKLRKKGLLKPREDETWA